MLIPIGGGNTDCNAGWWLVELCWLVWLQIVLVHWPWKGQWKWCSTAEPDTSPLTPWLDGSYCFPLDGQTLTPVDE